jgi:glycosyltransferase involved in cell wall biosynthesis
VSDASAQPPDVTIVAHDIGPIGGMELQLTELIGGLVERGHDVTVIGRRCDVSPHPRLRFIRVPGPSRPFAIAYPWFFLLGSLLVRLRARGVVHSTGAIVFNRVSICTVHFCHMAVARMTGFSRASKSGFAYRINEVVSRRLSRLGERWCYRPGRVSRLIGVSKGVERELREHFPRMRPCIEVIPNGVDTGEFHPAPPRSATAQELTAIFVGSEWERKGLGVAIEALAECPQVKLTVVGRGDTEGFRSLAEKLGAGDRVRFAGVSGDVATLYREADVLLLPTAYETFSLVTYEAAASGLPLLVTKVNGVEDLLEDGRHGWFIDRDPDDVGKKLRELLERPDDRRRMGLAARVASESFSWDSVVDGYSRLYREFAEA